jgi:hypothetical protein
MGKKSRSGFGLPFFDPDPDPGPGIFLTLDPGSGMEKFGSAINIPNQQHTCTFMQIYTKNAEFWLLIILNLFRKISF